MVTEYLGVLGIYLAGILLISTDVGLHCSGVAYFPLLPP